MAKKKETKANSALLTALQAVGWFRNISDKFQIGIPDNVGSYRGLTFGIEVKAVSEIPKNGMTPPKSGHVFSAPQIKELYAIQNEGGGVGLGVIICGSTLFWCTPEYIDENGQVDCNRLLKEEKYMVKTQQHGFRAFEAVLAHYWAKKMDLSQFPKR